jgi:transcription-repair coupling factor (superfamily II helicase)
LQGVTLQGDLSQLLHLLEGHPVFRELVMRLKKVNNKSTKALALEAAKPYLIASLYRNLNRPILVITAQPENAKKLYEQITVWSSSSELNLFPEPDTLAYQRIIADPSIEQERLQVLYSLNDWDKKGKPPFLIASAPALIQKTAAREDFFNSCSILRSGDEIDPVKLMGQWESMGYRVENMVEAPGTISRRGGIVDIYPPTSELPVRLEFFGNTIESIRYFDTASQRSQKVVTQAAICPATEILPSRIKTIVQAFTRNLDLANLNQESREQFEEELTRLTDGQRLTNISFYSPAFNEGNLLDYLPDESLVIMDEPSQIQEEVDYVENQSRELREQKIAAGELPSNFPQPYFDWKYLDTLWREKSNLSLLSWSSPGDSEFYDLQFNPAPSYAGQLPALIDKSKGLLKQNFRLIFVSNQASRLSELLEEEDIYSQPVTEIKQTPPPGTITLLQASLSEGWVLGNNYLLTDREIFGFVKERRLMKKRAVQRHKLLVDIKPGDYVVHIEHGIGQFAGVTTMNTDTTRKEYLLLNYAEGDKLYVPTDQIDRLSRYVGSGEQSPSLSRLGTQEWNRAKQKVKEAVEEIAQDLLQLYAKREVLTGYAFSPDSIWQREMEASFPYIETPDQMKVQEEVKEDMSRARPMDRLVVGDVGYGKTEIAIRAAFKAVMDNKQVAVLVPTTVLAEQHYITFKQRMGAFPIKMEVLSRFRTPKEQKAVIERLADGSVDICIGTHRLLQKDVVFKDLGLLIIDEEQRFGVAHKEYLKKLREQVDVLTLSATPIPRTLHMSLVGVRDMSVIETPPENRLPIRTYVAEYSEQLVREAILRELERNGQVFFVHNRVQGISYIAEKIKKLVPEASIDIAHGQMPEDQLEKVMVKFQQGESNVLVCTTIIESGLDLPNVNTLLVNRADRFGLTQLYQLRGRIGRGSNLAYAYFLYDKESRLNPAAEKRLRTIYEATELGAGFGIAMKDLEIRGAGSLLGTRQSGNISAVGFNLYTQLLAQAVEEQKALLAGHPKEAPAARPPEPSIDLPLKAFVPDDYISDTDLRLSIYQRLTAVSSTEQADDLAREMSDRFGNLPAEVQNLIQVVRIKCLAAKSGVEAISTNGDVVTIRIWPGIQLNRQKLVSYYRYGLKIGVTQLIIHIDKLGKDWLKMVEDIVKAIL